MTPEAENAIRSVARKCRAEIIKAIDGRPKSDHDSIITTLLDKRARTIQCLPQVRFQQSAGCHSMCGRWIRR